MEAFHCEVFAAGDVTKNDKGPTMSSLSQVGTFCVLYFLLALTSRNTLFLQCVKVPEATRK